MLIQLQLSPHVVGEDTGEDASYAPKESSDSISPTASVGRDFHLKDATALLQNTLEVQFVSSLVGAVAITPCDVPTYMY